MGSGIPVLFYWSSGFHWHLTGKPNSSNHISGPVSLTGIPESSGGLAQGFRIHVDVLMGLEMTMIQAIDCSGTEAFSACRDCICKSIQHSRGRCKCEF